MINYIYLPRVVLYRRILPYDVWNEHLLLSQSTSFCRGVWDSKSKCGTFRKYMYSVWNFLVLFYKIIIVSISKMISIICTFTCGLFLVKMFYWGTFARRQILFRTCMSNFFSGLATFLGANPILPQQFLGKK